MPPTSRRRIASMGVLIIAAFASLATSQGPPTVTRDLAGHAAFLGEASTFIDLHVAVAPEAAGDVFLVNLTLRSTPYGQPSPFALEARLRRAPGSEGPAGWHDSSGRLTGSDWQRVDSYWSARDFTCAPNVECVLDFQIEFRPTAVLLREHLVPWQLSVGVASVTSYEAVSAQSMSSSTPPAPALLALIAIGIGALTAASAYLVLRRWLRDPSRALMLSEIGVALSAGIVGALSVLAIAPGAGGDLTGILLVVAAPGALFVAVRRPPGATPRATVAVIGMLLVPTALIAFQTAAAVEVWAVVLLFLPIGALVAVGVIGLATPRSWWTSALRKPPYQDATVATAALVATLLVCALAAALTATLPDPVPSVLALFAVWVLLAYREWTESPSRSLRVAGIALAVFGVIGLVGIQGLANGFPFPRVPSPPAPVVPLAMSAVIAVLGFLVARKGGRRLVPWSRRVERGGRR